MEEVYWYKKKRSSKTFSHISPRKPEGPLDKYLLPNHKKRNGILSNG